jgi:hypothetical protein
MKIKILLRVLLMTLSVIITHTSIILQATTITDVVNDWQKCLKDPKKTKDECQREYDNAMTKCPDPDVAGWNATCRN